MYIEGIDGVKIIVTSEQYKKCKKSLEEQLEEKDKEIERLNNIIKEVREYIKNNKLYNEEYYTHNGYKYIKSVDDFSSRQYLLYLLDKGE